MVEDEKESRHKRKVSKTKLDQKVQAGLSSCALPGNRWRILPHTEQVALSRMLPLTGDICLPHRLHDSGWPCPRKACGDVSEGCAVLCCWEYTALGSVNVY